MMSTNSYIVLEIIANPEKIINFAATFGVSPDNPAEQQLSKLWVSIQKQKLSGLDLPEAKRLGSVAQLDRATAF